MWDSIPGAGIALLCSWCLPFPLMSAPASTTLWNSLITISTQFARWIQTLLAELLLVLLFRNRYGMITESLFPWKAFEKMLWNAKVDVFLQHHFVMPFGVLMSWISLVQNKQWTLCGLILIPPVPGYPAVNLEGWELWNTTAFCFHKVH